ncbi:MAG TPA: metallophosphoesterase family protein [Ktedonobacterales bacterium]|jgi:diadenosine tetraphosphatase ApaH/serine/threonine PP2A family protein phosphatase
MRYAIISDIHANQEALQAVLQELARIVQRSGLSFDGLWCLGDLVGYGPDPAGCVDIVRSHTDVVIAGNHDQAVAGVLPVERFNDSAQVTADWTRERLTQQHLRYLAGLAERWVIGACTLAHGSPRNPVWEYLTTEEIATLSFPCFSTPLCIVGHTHVPTIFLQREEQALPVGSAAQRIRRERQSSRSPLPEDLLGLETLEQLAAEQEALIEGSVASCEMFAPGEGQWVLPPGYRAIVNPGSVGQPRDGDPRAAFMVYDTERGCEFYRVEYPLEQTQRKIWRSGLPARMALRLSYGL